MFRGYYGQSDLFEPTDEEAEYAASQQTKTVPGTNVPITIRTEPIEIEGRVPQATAEQEGPPAPPPPVPASTGSKWIWIGVAAAALGFLIWGGKKAKKRYSAWRKTRTVGYVRANPCHRRRRR